MVLLLALELGVPEEEVVRAMPGELVKKLDLDHWEEMIRQFEGLSDVHVIVSNGAVTLENVGRFGKFSSSQRASLTFKLSRWTCISASLRWLLFMLFASPAIQTGRKH